MKQQLPVGSDDIARRLLNFNSILSLLSAARAAATDGGRCLRFSVGFPSLSGTVDGTVANRDSTSLRVNKGIALGTWVFSVAGALLAMIKRKSFGPLVFFGTTGTMLDIIMGISQCEREHAEGKAKLLEAQNTSWFHLLAIRT
ncbi:hypothetical protein POTOM_059239 [Populus tomentosa]|uniref:Uncharacterized protein n=1 Tax=Populus tomentosa TaxID=118781 RepID=A0A8X7XSG8_POPTO|nr:hypothetical protein POTOM_059239 [Populus tomentosa]